MADDFEIVPEKDFDSLKDDVEKIKKNPLGTTAEGKDLKESIDSLNDSITNLLLLFRSAADSIKAESHDTEVMSKKMMPLFDKVERLTEQNEKIAKGIVALAEMVDDLKTRQQSQSVQSRMERQRPSYSEPPQPMNFGMSQQGGGPIPSPMPQPPSFGNNSPPEDFSNPFGQTSQGSQPLPRMQMPPPAPPQKKKMFGFG